MTRELGVLLYGQLAGILRQETSRLGNPRSTTFTYEESYRSQEDPTPLSLCMPIQSRQHDGDHVLSWLWGLLPDNDRVIARWAAEFQVTASNPLALLSTPIGHDCAGAVQLAPVDELNALQSRKGATTWLSPDDFEQLIRELNTDNTAWRGTGSAPGQFSLAGAQAKTALAYDPNTQQWGVPTGAHATTHILKPGIATAADGTALPDQALNEYLCMTAAAELRLPAAAIQIIQVADIPVIVVRRYDRLPGEGKHQATRIHQEDLCQSLGIHPANKYENQGGPGVTDVVELFATRMTRTAAKEATDRFIDALAFNWVIGGTDAHAKNYSVLLLGGDARLAPLYDIASALPYWNPRELKLAMRIGTDYRVWPWSNPWRGLADRLGLDTEGVSERVLEVVRQAPGAFERVASDPDVVALNSTLPQQLLRCVAEQSARCEAVLAPS